MHRSRPAATTDVGPWSRCGLAGQHMGEGRDGNQFTTDVKNFATHEDVTWRESMDGFSVLLGAGLLASVLAFALWWRHRHT